MSVTLTFGMFLADFSIFSLEALSKIIKEFDISNFWIIAFISFVFLISTEKSTNMSEQNKIVFKVPTGANKTNLKKNIEKIFKVNVTKINIINKQNRVKITRGKKVRISGFKKAIITLKKGQSIDLTTGI